MVSYLCKKKIILKFSSLKSDYLLLFMDLKIDGVWLIWVGFSRVILFYVVMNGFDFYYVFWVGWGGFVICFNYFVWIYTLVKGFFFL